MKCGFPDQACFSAQQSAEKAARAVLQKLGAESWGHSVFDMLSRLRDRFDVSEDLLEYALELERHIYLQDAQCHGFIENA